MTDITLESLGISQDVLAEKLVEKISDRFFMALHFDPEGDEWLGDTKIANKISDMAKTRLNEIVDQIGEKHVLPRVTELFETLVLQRTSEWGEKKGETISFTEYMVQRADSWLREPVDRSGKTKADSGGYQWSASGSRAQYLIDKHLQYHVETAMQGALKNANDSIIGGLESAMRIQLKTVADKLKVTVVTK